MLDSDFPDQHVRAFAVRILTHIPDEQLEDYLLQLVQVCCIYIATHTVMNRNSRVDIM